MPWMTRKSGRAYYYRKVREGDQVRSVYVPIDQAEAAAQVDLERAQQRAEARKAQHEAAATRAQVQAVQRIVRLEPGDAAGVGRPLFWTEGRLEGWVAMCFS